MSPSRTIAPSCSRTTSLRNSSALRRSVRAVMSMATIWPLVEPTAASTLLDCSAALTSLAVTFSAAIFSGFSQMRMAKLPAPMISALCTPGTVTSFGWMTRVR